MSKPIKPRISKMTAREQAAFDKREENRKRNEEISQLLKMYCPLGDYHCIPEPSKLEPIGMYEALDLGLNYFYTGLPCKKGHIDVTIFEGMRPLYCSGGDICRTCLEEKIAKKLPWRTRSHWRTEPVVVGPTPKCNRDRTRDQYATKGGYLPLPSEVDYIGKKEAIRLDIGYYLPFHPCPRGHIDFRNIYTGRCYSCVLEEDAIKAGKKFNPKKRLGKVESLKYTTKQTPKHKPKYFDTDGMDDIELASYMSRIQEETKQRTKFIRKQVAEILYYVISDAPFPPSLQQAVYFTSAELRSHIETKFNDDMNWSNWGRCWELDHIVPVKFFADNELLFSDIVNSIQNFQPLTPRINAAKKMYMLRSDAIAIRENLLLPKGLDFKEGWDKDYRVCDVEHWLECEPCQK